MALLCNGKVDCPKEDDEHVSFCSTSNNGHRPQSIASGTSSFSTNQFAPTNISIINNVRDREFSEDLNPNQPPGILDHALSRRNAVARPNNNGDHVSNWPVPDSPDSDTKPGVQNGVGFMFRVDNMVIYNSQVKMFNQNSENIAPPSEEAANNATGQGHPQQQHANDQMARLTNSYQYQRDNVTK